MGEGAHPAFHNNNGNHVCLLPHGQARGREGGLSSPPDVGLGNQGHAPASGSPTATHTQAAFSIARLAPAWEAGLGRRWEGCPPACLFSILP